MEIIESINAGNIVFDPVAIHAVFAKIGVKNQITVFGATGVMHVFTIQIFAVDKERGGRGGGEQFEKLLEKRS